MMLLMSIGLMATLLLLPIPCQDTPRYHQYRKSWGINAMGGVVVEGEAENGVTGVGKMII